MHVNKAVFTCTEENSHTDRLQCVVLALSLALTRPLCHMHHVGSEK